MVILNGKVGRGVYLPERVTIKQPDFSARRGHVLLGALYVDCLSK
jgi:hypothetical protein